MSYKQEKPQLEEPKPFTEDKNLQFLQTLKHDHTKLLDNIMLQQQEQKFYKPLIYSSLIQLFVSFVFAIIVYHNLSIEKFYRDLTDAYTVISHLQRQIQLPVLTDIRISPDCNDSIGYLPGTSRGCICPDMTTSTQICLPPCQVLENLPYQIYRKFNGLNFCLSYGNSTGFNMIKEVNNDQKGITIQNKKYQFSYVNREYFGEFYKIILAPGKPCYNSKLGQYKQSNLSYPFQDIQYVGCDNYGAWSFDAVELGSIRFDQLLQENKINTSAYPFFEKYNRYDDLMNMYILRKHYVQDADECKSALQYKFTNSYVSCLMIQVVEQIVCYFAIIFLLLGIIFIIATKVVRKTQKKKIRSRVQLQDVFEKSIIILGVVMAILVISSKFVFLYGLYNENGLRRTAKYTQRLLAKPCFTSPGVIKSVTVVRDTVSECTSNISTYLLFWVIFEGLYLISGYFILRSKFD